MIYIDENEAVTLSIESGEAYRFDSDDDYRKVVLLITNPSPEIVDPISFNDLEVTEEDPEKKAICQRYREVILAFFKKRKEILGVSSEDGLASSV